MNRRQVIKAAIGAVAAPFVPLPSVPSSAAVQREIGWSVGKNLAMSKILTEAKTKEWPNEMGETINTPIFRRDKDA